MNSTPDISPARLRPSLPWSLLLAGLLWLLPGILHAESSPAVRSRMDVTGPSVRVADLFSSSLPAALGRHANTIILKAPLPGKEHTIPGPFLGRKLALLAGVKTLSVKIPKKVTVFRRGQSLDDARLTPLLKKAAEGTWKAPITFTDLRVVGRRTLPLGTVSITPETKKLRIRKDRIELPVSVSVDGEPMGRLTLTANANVIKTVVVATETVRQGEELTAADVTLAPRPVPPSDVDVLTDAALVVGHMATRPIRPDTVLTHRMVKIPPLVERGDGVRIRYMLGGLVITATGIASETGGMGEFIKVKNSRSGKRITCRIVGERHVEPLL